MFGVFAGLYAPLKHRGITGVMAAGAGILIAAASLDLIVAAAGEAGRSGWGSHCSPAATHDSFPFNDLIAVLGSTCVLKPPKERDAELRTWLLATRPEPAENLDPAASLIFLGQSPKPRPPFVKSVSG